MKEFEIDEEPSRQSARDMPMMVRSMAGSALRSFAEDHVVAR